MSLSIDEMMRQHFELASLRQMAKAVPDPDVWRQTQDVIQRGRDLRLRAKDLFDDRYERRVAIERRRRVDEAGAFNRDFDPAWAATDKFHPDRTRALAEHAVRLAHERRIARIDKAEANALAKLLPKREDTQPLKLHQVFNRRARDGPRQD